MLDYLLGMTSMAAILKITGYATIGWFTVFAPLIITYLVLALIALALSRA